MQARIVESGGIFTAPTLLAASFWLFAAAFISYLAASFLYGAGAIGQRRAKVMAASGGGAAPQKAWYDRAPEHALRLTSAGTVALGLAIIARWQGAGQWPTSNMFEFVTFFGFTTMVAFLILNRAYRLPALGTLMAPLGVVILGYASVFPKEVQPLIPALQSYWLWLHVSTAAAGEGFFAISFVAGVLYLLRTREQAGPWDRRCMEILFWVVCLLLSFVMLAFALRNTGVSWVIRDAGGPEVLYHLPPVIGPSGSAPGQGGSWLGIPAPLLAAPGWIRGKNMNTLFWALLAGSALYWGVRRLLRKPWSESLGTWTQNLNAAVLDEVCYRAVAIGYPVFTLGGLVFAMIWAKEAWGRYWFWDPKETWALITWLTYSGFLHARINRGWEGRPSAWLSVIGFGVVLFTLVGVNLLIVGLHSYAGGD